MLSKGKVSGLFLHLALAEGMTSRKIRVARADIAHERQHGLALQARSLA